MAISYFRNLLAMTRKPYFPAVPMFPAGQDMSWIPSVGSNIVSEFASETPDGVNNVFTFTSTPQYLVWNGQLLRPPQDFTVSGFTATMPIAPAVGDELYGII